MTHFLYARHALSEPWVLADVWGRPTVKLLHVLPAQVPGQILGLPTALVAVRLTSLAMALVAALLTWRIARRLGGPRPMWAGLCLLASPLVFLHASAVLTELPFAALAAAATLCYARRQFLLAALLVGLLPATRPEGIGVLLVTAVALLLHRKWLILPALAVGPLLWAVAGWWLTGRPAAPADSAVATRLGMLPAPIVDILAWLPAAWPYSGQSTYDSGPLLKFVGMLPAVVGPGLLPFVLVGVVVSLRRGLMWHREHAARVELAVVGLPVGVLGVHSLLHWTGSMASSGDVRYLVAVTPYWALLAWRGFTTIAPPWPRLTLAVLILVPPLLLQAVYPVVPLRADAGATAARDVAAWYTSPASAELREDRPRLVVDHPSFRFSAGTTPFNGGGRSLVQEAPAGTLYLWDDIYSTHNAAVERTVDAAAFAAAGWIDRTPADFPGNWRLFASPSAHDSGPATKPGR